MAQDRLSQLQDDVTDLTSKVSVLQTKVDSHTDSLKDVSAGLDSVKWWAAVFNGGVTVLAFGFLAFIALIWFLGESKIKEIASDVFQDELKTYRTYTQSGKWTEANRISTDRYSFKWPLIEPVDAILVSNVSTQPLTPLSGTVATAKITPDGKSCVMTLNGDKSVLDAISLPIDATVTISVRDEPESK